MDKKEYDEHGVELPSFAPKKTDTLEKPATWVNRTQFTWDEVQQIGAQQREAGRRDRDEEIARLTVDLGAAKIRINKYERAVAASVEALATRQPVSKKLTNEQISSICVRLSQQGHGNYNIDASRALARAVENFLRSAVPPAKAEGLTEKSLRSSEQFWSALRHYRGAVHPETLRAAERGLIAAIVAAVPPAKAEGMSDTELLDWVMSNSGAMSLKIRGGDSIGWFIYDPYTDTSSEYFSTAREAVVAAILAQQAKGKKP